MSLREHNHRRWRGKLCVAVLVGAAALCGCRQEETATRQVFGRRPWWRKLTVVAFNVGQGNAQLVLTPNGRAMLYDGGPADTNLAKRLKDYLPGGKIDLLCISHVHGDHLNGLVEVIPEFEIQRAWDTGLTDDTRDRTQYDEVCKLLRDRNVKVSRPVRGEVLELDRGVSVRVLHPDAEDLDMSKGRYLNFYSYVLQVRYRQAAALLTGDIEQDAEWYIMHRNDSMSGDLLMGPHHGSRWSSSPSFLRTVKPKFIIDSAGQNRFQMPQVEAVARQKATGARVFRTDQDGEIVARTDGRNWEVTWNGVPLDQQPHYDEDERPQDDYPPLREQSFAAVDPWPDFDRDAERYEPVLIGASTALRLEPAPETMGRRRVIRYQAADHPEWWVRVMPGRWGGGVRMFAFAVKGKLPGVEGSRHLCTVWRMGYLPDNLFATWIDDQPWEVWQPELVDGTHVRLQVEQGAVTTPALAATSSRPVIRR